jgi:hypothetical protein
VLVDSVTVFQIRANYSREKEKYERLVPGVIRRYLSLQVHTQDAVTAYYGIDFHSYEGTVQYLQNLPDSYSIDLRENARKVQPPQSREEVLEYNIRRVDELRAELLPLVSQGILVKEFDEIDAFWAEGAWQSTVRNARGQFTDSSGSHFEVNETLNRLREHKKVVLKHQYGG